MFSGVGGDQNSAKRRVGIRLWKKIPDECCSVCTECSQEAKKNQLIQLKVKKKRKRKGFKASVPNI